MRNFILKNSAVFLLNLLSLIPNSKVDAHQWEGGLFIGTTQYLGDMTPRFIIPQNSLVAVGPVVRYQYTPHLTFKGSLIYGNITGNDRYQSQGGLQKRAWHFNTSLMELAVNAEWNILGVDCRQGRFSPYITAGMAWYYFNPTIRYNDQWVQIEPMTEQGQVLSYKKLQVAIPVGAGLKYRLSDGLSLGLETAFRKTFSDYLDGYQNGIPQLDPRDPGFAPRTATYTFTPHEPGEGSGFQNTGLRQTNTNGGNKDWYIFTGITLTKTFSCNRKFKMHQPMGIHGCYRFD